MATTTLAIIGGAGHEGRGLATRLALAGCDLVIGSRDRRRATEAASQLREHVRTLAQSRAAPAGAIEASTNGDAIAAVDVVVLAVPYSAVDALLVEYGALIRPGALVIDVTVPMVFEGGRPVFVEVPEGSAAEHVRARLPAAVGLACAFKTLPARLLEQGDAPLECDDFVCGDTAESRDRAMAVVARVEGLRPVDVGPLDAARALERMTWLAVRVNKRYKTHAGRFRVLGLPV